MYPFSGNAICVWRTIYTHNKRLNILHATSGKTKCAPHQVIQDVRHMGKYYVYLKNSICAISRNAMYVWRTIYTIYCTPHQDIQNVRHIRNYRKYYTCVKNNIFVTSGDTIYCTPHQEIQEIRHIRKYRMYTISGNAIYFTPHQDIQKVRHIRKYRMYAISGNAQNHIYATSGDTICCTQHQEIHESMTQQEIQDVHHITKC